MTLIFILWKWFIWLSHSCGIIFIPIMNPALQKVFSNVGVLYQGKKVTVMKCETCDVW